MNKEESKIALETFESCRKGFKETLMDEIGFLSWAKLDIDQLDLYDRPVKVAISPDVKSLWIMWEWENGEIQYEKADYPYDDDFESIVDWLNEEVADDAWETFEPGERDFDDMMHDYSNKLSYEQLPVFDLLTLELRS